MIDQDLFRQTRELSYCVQAERVQPFFPLLADTPEPAHG
jgi:hypothetical protein